MISKVQIRDKYLHTIWMFYLSLYYNTALKFLALKFQNDDYFLFVSSSKKSKKFMISN